MARGGWRAVYYGYHRVTCTRTSDASSRISFVISARGVHIARARARAWACVRACVRLIRCT